MESKIPIPGSSTTNVPVLSKSCVEMVSVGCSTNDFYSDDYEAYEPRNSTRNKLVLRAVINVAKLKRRKPKRKKQMYLRKEDNTFIYNMEKLEIKSNSINEKKDTELSIQEQNISEIREKIENMKISH
ncbi:uncharacterized protein LOC124426650 [Vespa crabro]|uniref:uncharacterized protein LOC124426650 n=1 Tax=Vespa crabro TaxID=7445 RepID=UPI001F022F81|nr:uncharacterized protein LOC124426650 [Vespa crabro]XP_046824549.1 uncharacterized protein LOC124426650 [Vespa crabro]